MRFPSCLLLFALVWIRCPAQEPDFVRDIQPILRESCWSCHGEKKQKGSLRLDSKELALKGGSSGPLLKPGKSSESYLLARLRGEGDEPRMPAKAPALSSAQIALIAAWIDAGAVWPDSASVAHATLKRHWAYSKPVRPIVPVPLETAWVRNPIDAFVLVRLEQKRLSHAAEATREQLLRRLSLDLIGLPPTPEEVAAFLADQAPDAYERQVDRLLASPHYGERWAQRWLDLARYADTDGFNFDQPRVMWPWRDWVIRALNADMPFDRFTIEQLAGDLLPEATIDQRIATGFHRNTMHNTEGGVDPEEARWETLLDRTGTTASVWMGSTLACAQCHNHKYDPFTQRDFYAFLAYFDHADEVELPVSALMEGREAKAGKDGKDAKKGKSKDAVLTSLVFAEKPTGEPQTHLRIRGAYVAKGDLVTAATPGFLPAPKPGLPHNRLGLARWLVDPDHPLTARVTVNRAWETFFGRGLVATSEDFGTQGEPPSHPELLDWLAVELVDRGWSMKALHRLIVTSATYRQASTVTPALLERDPANRLLARAPRYRLDAELVRDNALTISGLLTPAIGGPSVFPPAPKDLGRMNTNKESIPWQTSPGPDRYRRGMYTFWRRTAPYASFANFDAPSREFCTLRRPRSNTPMQALSGLNDPAFWEAAQALGRIMAGDPGPTPAERLGVGFRRCTARVPTTTELAALISAFTRERSALTQDAKAVAEICGLAGDVDRAAYTMLANVLLNLDETLTRE
jgi:cytochrome c553